MSELRLLGPVQLRVDGRSVDLGPAKQRTVLAALLVDVEQPTPVETLIDRVWGNNPPASGRAALYSYVARLRHVLRLAVDGDEPPWRLEYGPGGYRFMPAGDQVDLFRFRRLVGLARNNAGDDAKRVALLAEARALWHGRALADLPGEWAARTRAALDQERLDADVLWARIQLGLGQAAEMIGPLREALDAHPLVEPLAAMLMEALLRDGRTAEAVDCYGVTRRRLAEELGVEPGPELRRLHLSLLRRDGQRGRRTGAVEPEPDAVRPMAVPVQLPMDAYGFAGRVAEIVELDRLLAAARTRPDAVAVFAVCGSAGVGKTALAVHWAHRVANQFPDGTLFVNLRGFDPTGDALRPADAVRLLLDALGVPPDRVSVHEEAQVGLYRSLLAGRRVLVVLDNAATSEQVRPLLPGSPGCVALVTSRDLLSGLGATEAAHPITLDVLGTAEAVDLLATRIGAARLAAEPTAVAEIVDRCARLPLALAVVAARAVAQPTMSLAGLAAELAEDRLDAFVDTDPAADLRAVLSSSYRTRSASAARLFRLLEVHPGPDLDVSAAASLVGVAPSQARRDLAELVRAHLVTEPRTGWFAFHDLLRAYAGELARMSDDTGCRRAALHRLVDHFAHGAVAVGRTLAPGREPIELATARPGAVFPAEVDVETPARALAWVSVRRSALLATMRLAARAGFHTHVRQLAWGLGPALDRGGHWRDLAEAHELALAAADRLNDRRGQAYAHRMLGRASIRLDDLDAARVHFEQALRLSAEIGDELGCAHTHLSLAWLDEQLDRWDAALDHASQAGAVYTTAGHLAGQGSALSQTGWYHAQLGRFEAAIAACERALSLQLAAGHRYGQAGTWDSLGFAHHHLGQHDEATECYRRALELHREMGDSYREAATLVRSADCHDAAGHAVAACLEWTLALTILDGLDHADAARVRLKLSVARPG